MAEIKKYKSILIVTSAFPLWREEGQNEFTLEFAQSLAATFNVVVLAPRGEKSKAYEEWDGIPIYRHNQFPFFNVELAYGSGIVRNISKNPLLLFCIPFFFMMQVMAIRKLVKKHNVSVINAHWIIPQCFSAILYKFFFNRNITVIGTSHGSDLFGLNFPVAHQLKKIILKRLDALTAVSEALKEKAIELGYHKDILACPMGVNTNKFQPLPKDSALLQKHGITGPAVLFIGNCIKEKGIEELVTAMPTLVKTFPSIKLLVIGVGPLLPQLKQFIANNNIAEHVEFLGIIPNKNLPQYYSLADVFVLPSYTEGYSLVVREALSCGVPVVATKLKVFTDDAALSSLLHFVNIGSSEDMVNEISFVLNNKPHVEQKSKEYRQYVLQHASWDIIGKKYVGLFLNYV